MSSITSRVFSDAIDWEVPTILAYSFETGSYEVTKALNENPTPETLEALLVEYPDYELHEGGKGEWTALAVAIEKKALPLIRYILDKKPELVNGAWRYTLPYVISATCDLEILKEFVSRGAKINLATRKGRTALSASACYASHLPTTKYLLQHGAIIYNKERNRILESATRGKETKISYIEQPRNVDAAIELMLGENMFLNGDLHSERTESLLPYEIKGKIWSFLNEGAIPPEKTKIDLEVSFDTGFGNSLEIRGTAPGLSWDRGLPMTWTEGHHWHVPLKITGDFEYKVVLRTPEGIRWEMGENRHLSSPPTPPSF